VVQGESKEPEKVYEQIVDALQNNEFTEEDFERTKKKAYGENVYDYDDVIAICRTYINTAIQGIDALDYITALNEIDYEYAKKVRGEIFQKDKAVLSVVKPNEG
jgi:predicted Zn-dependent peptidase